LVEVEVTVGQIKDNVSPLFGHIAYNHRYVIFQDVEPGAHEWLWVITAPFTGGVPVVAGRSDVNVVAAGS
jgi:hypothetical protein